MGSSSGQYDLSFKILLIGDSGVGKSSLLVSFISGSVDDLAPTIGVDFKIKQLTVDGKRLKLTIWDTGDVTVDNFLCLAYYSRMRNHLSKLEKPLCKMVMLWADETGQERFRTLTSSYYRGAQGIILVYDVTKRETFTNLSEIWAKEVDLHSTNQDCVKMLVGNKVDKDSERFVSKEEGATLAKELGCLFFECSATTQKNVHQCFEELALKIMEIPGLLEEGSTVVKRNIIKQKPEHNSSNGGCCS